MTYRNNILIAPNPMTLVVQNLEADMVSLGWSNVWSGNIQQSNTTSGNTQGINVAWDCFQSPGNLNSIGNSWFILIGVDQLTNTQMYMTVCANSVSTGSIRGFPPVAASMPVGLNSLANQSFQSANTCNASGNVFTCNTQSVANNGNGMQYWYSVTIDRVIIGVANIGVSQTGTGIDTMGFAATIYAGTYDSFMPLSQDPFPILVSNVASFTTTPSSVATAVGLSLSEPANTTTVATNFIVSTSGNYQLSSGLDPYLASGGANFGNCIGRFPMTRIVVIGRGSTPGTCGIRGLLKDMFWVGSAGTTGNPPGMLKGATANNSTGQQYVYLGDGLCHTIMGSGLLTASGTTGSAPWMPTV